MNENQVQVDADGNWDFEVPENLEPGTYTITLRGTDANGNQIEKPYTFTIQANASETPELPDTGIITNPFSIILMLLTLAIVISKLIKNKRSFEEKVLSE